jgi:hypothetical protein
MNTMPAMSLSELAEVLQTDRRTGMFDEMVEQYDRKNAVEAHTVYRVNGRAICVVARDGQTLFDTADDFQSGGGLTPADQAGSMGLTGEQYMEYVAKQIGENLRRRYTNTLRVARYDEGAAPAMGALREEMFGITRDRWKAIALSAALGLGSVELPHGILVLAKN